MTNSSTITTALKNEEAEALLVQSLITDNSYIPKARQAVSSNDFFNPAYRSIYEAILSLWLQDATRRIDPLLVVDALGRSGKGDSYSKATLEILKEPVALDVLGNCLEYANIIYRHSENRKIDSSAAVIKSMANDQTMTPKEKKGKLLSTLINLGERQSQEAVSLADSADDLINEIQTNKFGITTGFTKVDLMTKGLFPGEMVIVAGRPSMGKTSFMIDMALAAWKEGKKILILSLETSLSSLKERVISNLARVHLDTIRFGMESADEKEEIQFHIDSLKKNDLWVYSECGLTPTDVYVISRLVASQHGLDVIYLDYLQLLEANTPNRSRQQEVTEICRHIKKVAMDLNVPIVVLSQLSRANENRDCTRPILSDLRESGSIEQDAHKVILLHREDYYRLRKDPKAEIDGKADCIVAKNKQGAIGDVIMSWIPEYFTFEEISL